MIPEPFLNADIGAFLKLAQQEEWVAEQWELNFLLAAFPQGSLVIRDEAGQGIGFVNALAHGTSGWIGNLIVAAEYRGRGIGERLFLASLQALRQAGLQTVWLTASKMGMRLYEKHNFSRIDTIVRWVGAGCAPDELTARIPAAAAPEVALRLDAQAWGDRREQLLSAVMTRGAWLADSDGFATVQPCGERYQIGPFAALNGQKAADLLQSARQMVPTGAILYLDSPSSNHNAGLLFNHNYLRIAGSTELMYCGEKPAYQPDLLYGLATMGSCG